MFLRSYPIRHSWREGDSHRKTLIKDFIPEFTELSSAILAFGQCLTVNSEQLELGNW